MIIIRNPELEKALWVIAAASDQSIDETAVALLIGSCAEGAAWGDTLGLPAPVCKNVKTSEGQRLTGDALYQDCYKQTQVFINSLLLGEKLLMTLIKILRKEDLLTKIEPGQKAAVDRYIEKIERENFN